MNKIKFRALLGTFALVVIVGTGTPSTALAATRTASTHATINRSTIHLGSTVTISGYVSPNLHGHVVRLQRYYSRAWHTMVNHKLSSYSRFSFTTTPSAALKYSYRVYDPPTATGYRSSVSATRTVTVQSRYVATLVTYTTTGEWQGPTIRIPTADYTIHYSYSCTDPYSNFLSVNWTGKNGGYESLWSEPANGLSSSGTWYGHGGAQYGYFSVATQATCSWTFNVKYFAWH